MHFLVDFRFLRENKFTISLGSPLHALCPWKVLAMAELSLVC